MKQTAGTIFVEVGPGRTLTTLVHQHESGESKSPAYTTIRHPKERLSDYTHLLRQVAALWTHGVPVDFAAIDRTPRNRKIIHIPTKDIKEGTDRLLYVRLITEECKMIIHAGKRFFALTTGNIKDFMGARGRRGKMLPRGFRRVTDIVVE